MLAKLALRNIRRSVRDYAIYFVTLVFGVAVFYAFNSVGSQAVLFDIESTAKADIFENTQLMLGMFSYVIAFVLGFLIVYANRFLIKRRKHEFGIYLTLGMGSGEVSRIVLYETVLVGLASLGIGLVAGFLLSQALSFATAAMFAITMSNYQFIFSLDALKLTLACFLAIYVVVAVFNLISVRRYRLIDLLSAHSKNERAGVRGPWVSLLGFIVAVGILAYAYYLLIQSGMVELGDPRFTAATISMLVGTLVLFWSLAGFVISVLQRLRGVYLRGLIPFTMRQIASKVNTAFVSLWAVSVLLFFAITTFATGMGMISLFNDNIENTTPYDATLRADVFYGAKLDSSSSFAPGEANTDRRDAMADQYPELYAEAQKWDFSSLAKLEAEMPHWNDVVEKAAELDVYIDAGLLYKELFDDAGVTAENSGIPEVSMDSVLKQGVPLVGVGQLNEALALTGKDPVTVNEGTYMVCNTLAMTEKVSQRILDQQTGLTVADNALVPVGSIIEVNLETTSMDSSACLVVVPDAVIEDLKAEGAIPFYSYVDIMYKEPGAASDALLTQDLGVVQPVPEGRSGEINGEAITWSMEPWPVTQINTQVYMRDQAVGLSVLISYLALYLGFVLLVTTAAILAIQQLSEAADSQPRYRLLSRLGCDARMINGSLLAQVLVYFLAPLAVAACHSACAIGVLSKELFSALGSQIEGSIVLAALFVGAIYGAYLLVTYFAARAMARQAIKG